MNKKKGEDASSELLEAFLGSIGPSWGRLGDHVLEAPMWPKVGPEFSQTIRLYVPRDVVESLRGTHGGGIVEGGDREKRRGGGAGGLLGASWGTWGLLGTS